MNITTTETHTRTHFVSLSKDQVERIIAQHIKDEVGGATFGAKFQFEWGEASIDSGLRKEPQIIVRAVVDLMPKPA